MEIKMSVSYTAEQQKVIDTHGCNLLVSAAAGSGKTAVLAERIVKMVSDGAHPVDIDRLLVVTFTNAAAAEMRERISNAIGEKLVREPENEHLQKQAALLHNAQITTIDSFCLFVIRNHFHTIGLDPGFRIADEGELKLLQKDVLSDVLEQCYQKGEASFLDCMEYFSTGSRDSAVEEAVLKLYDFAMSSPFPEEWLLARKNDYDVPEADAASALMELEWMKELMEETSLLLRGMLEQTSQILALSEMPDGPYMYGELLEQEKGQLESLLAASKYEERYLRFQTLAFGRLSSKKDTSVSTAKREIAKSVRTEVKEQLQAMQINYFANSPEEIVRQMAVCGKAAGALVDLTLLFQETFARMKREKNILDFDDIEHFALSILLRKREDGGVEATETALEYRSHFAEILIDEYQDSNLVQEYLLSAVSGEAGGTFNRFMVGDVKQSIYKFRLARPELFMEKYHAYKETEGGETLRIDLHKNFRSREQVLASTNAVFAQVMRKELGGIDYDEKAALYPGAVYPEAEASADAGNDTELLLFMEEGKDSEAGKGADGMTGMDPGGKNARAINAKQREAYGIARKIKELTASFSVTDKETGKLRKASYKDIVILLRTTAGWDEEWKEILEEEGIPVHVTSKTGYFATTEIQELLHFLQILDNPLQDIPFYGVLHSYFGGFSEEEIAAVKAAYPEERYLYDAVKAYAAEEAETAGGGTAEQEKAGAGSSERMEGGLAENGPADTLRRRLREFLDRIGRYREMTVYMPVHELLRTIIREYAYLPYVLAKPGGSRRRANTEMLLVKAADYEKTSYYGLYHFLRYIEQLEKYDVDYGEANLQDENADVVRIMSIHKSKGLEFPICFVAGLAKGFNNRDTNGHLVMDVERGIGVDYVDSGLRISSRNLRRSFIAFRLRKDNLAEELRILYVAMTRAREKLILTGTLKQPEKKFLSLAALQWTKEEGLPYGTLLRAGSFLDVLLCAAARNRCFDPVWQLCGMEPESRNPFYRKEMNLRVSPVPWEDTLEAQVREFIVRENDRRKLLLFDAAGAQERIDKNLLAIMSDKFSYEYPYGNLKDLYTKTTVSELKKAGMREETDFSFSIYEEEQVVPYLPKFLKQGEAVNGSDRGSAFHKVMELFDFKLLAGLDDFEGEKEKRPAGNGTEEAASGKGSASAELEALARAELERMRSEGKLPQAYYDAVSVPKIAAFLESCVAKRMAAAARAGKLYREQPFVLGLPAARLNGSFPKEETVLIQGIIDVFFEEKGSYVVVDYKTDAVDSAGELVKRYKTQLDYYAEALEQLSGYGRTGEGMRAAEKIIYSFRLGEEIWV
ncbi:MAG: helicase-exonuclease AddAB subunit AddA [Blautia sp.]|nr:helicase-exonuclease AddAB subunit AddA [Blautia sp.]MCM1200799.1 helicase-exonuclease AddAB subunit AddA [Bacteroides fragilis]